MAEAVGLFERCLETHGIDANVSFEKGEVQSSYNVTCHFGSTTLHRSKTLTYDEDSDLPDECVAKEVALMAEEMARDIKLETTNRLVWVGEKHQRLDMNKIENTPPRASCPYCEATATFPESERIYDKQAELSNPKPMVVEEETLYNSLEPHQKVLVELYLIGELRESCDIYCPNRTERLISQ